MKTRPFPGMLDTSKEYFINGSEVMLLTDGVVVNFDDVDHPELKLIIKREKDLQKILNVWYPNNETMQLKTLARCRFGALNFQPDFSGEESSADYVTCSKRGKCLGENIICKPLNRFNVEMTTVEVDIMIQLAGEEKNTTIASRMGFAVGTFFVMKTSIYSKVKTIINKPFLTKQQLAKFLFLEGLL
ncbi:hypothetical protein [Chryseobacterium sp. Hurlbut01]|uniref:hypothetical protein n=1 Tax=Chryseobacterium sp. Hurlbut01 TaxID=1681828 RepID=UPI00067BCC57|nr:hypothetical protein [Chryseobacterium sp. Hurlbut01]